MSDLEHRIAVARGEAPADIVLKNGSIFDLMTGELIVGDVAIVGDRIAGVP